MWGFHFYHKLNFQVLDKFEIKPNADENENDEKSEWHSRKVQGFSLMAHQSILWRLSMEQLC